MNLIERGISFKETVNNSTNIIGIHTQRSLRWLKSWEGIITTTCTLAATTADVVIFEGSSNKFLINQLSNLSQEQTQLLGGFVAFSCLSIAMSAGWGMLLGRAIDRNDRK